MNHRKQNKSLNRISTKPYLKLFLQVDKLLCMLDYSCLLCHLDLFVSFFAAGPRDTPMDLVLEKTYDAKTGKGMPDL